MGKRRYRRRFFAWRRGGRAGDGFDRRVGTDGPSLAAMTRIRPFVLAALASLLLLVLAAPALATEGTNEGDASTTTVAEGQVFENGEPAIVIPDVADEEPDQPWTSRYIYPTIVMVTVLLIIGIIWGYNRRIRHRYTVAAE